jgi:hypothetical protein
MSNEALAKMIDNIANKDFNKANDAFSGALNSKLQDVLDQARTKIAGQIFDPQVGVEPDEELVAGEVSNDDLEDAEAEAAADEVEAEVDEVEEFDLDDEELDDNDTGTEEDTSGDDEEPEETSDEDSK